MNRAALRSLLPGLVAAGLLLLASAAAAWFSWQGLQRAQAQNRDANLAARQARDHLRRVQRDEPEIRRTLARFDTLLHSGLVGPEQRLDWSDRVRSIAKQRQIPELNFEIAPQRRLQTMDARGDYVVYASTMHIKARLLHEGELLRVLYDLSAPVPGQVVPTRCVLERTGGNDAAGEAVGVRADCDLDWITISTPASRQANGGTP